MSTPAVPLFELSRHWSTAIWLSCLVWLALEAWVFSRDRRVVVGTSADRGSRRWIVVAIGLALVLAFAAAHRRSPRLPGPAEALLSVAVVLIWVGMGVRLWAILTLGRHFRTSVILQERHELIRSGPYRLVRNPSYTGSMLTLTGLGLSLGKGVSLALLVLLPLAAYLWRMRIEETALAARFGEDYQQYRARTWRLIPWVW